MSREDFRIDAAALGNAATAYIDVDEDEDPDAWKDGAPTCACKYKRNAVSGRLERTDDCHCYRYRGHRIDKHGDPKAIVEELPLEDGPRETRTDSLEGIVNKADFAEWSRGRVTSWNFDGVSIRVPVFVNEHVHDTSKSVGVAVCRLNAEGDLRTRIEFNSTGRARDAIERVKSGELIGLSPKFWQSKDGNATLHHVALAAHPRNPKALITSTSFRADAAPLATLGGMVDAVDRNMRTAHVTASTTDDVDGEAITKWDLSRFTLNPCVLWSHDADSPPIGRARDVTFDKVNGLQMTIEFAPLVNARAEEIFQLVASGMLKALSVGYTVENGVAVLDEVSFVSIGADPNALVNNPATEDVMQTNTDAKTRAKRTSPGPKRKLRDYLREKLGDATLRKGDVRVLLGKSTEDDLRAMSAATLRALLTEARKSHAGRTLAARADALDPLDVDAARSLRDANMRDAWRYTDNQPGAFRADAAHDPLDVDAARARRDARMRDAWKMPGPR